MNGYAQAGSDRTNGFFIDGYGGVWNLVIWGKLCDKFVINWFLGLGINKYAELLWLTGPEYILFIQHLLECLISSESKSNSQSFLRSFRLTLD